MIFSPVVIDAFKLNDRVIHRKDNSIIGTITSISENKLSVTVKWDNSNCNCSNGCDNCNDFQWQGKLLLTTI